MAKKTFISAGADRKFVGEGNLPAFTLLAFGAQSGSGKQVSRLLENAKLQSDVDSIKARPGAVEKKVK